MIPRKAKADYFGWCIYKHFTSNNRSIPNSEYMVYVIMVVSKIVKGDVWWSKNMWSSLLIINSETSKSPYGGLIWDRMFFGIMVKLNFFFNLELLTWNGTAVGCGLFESINDGANIIALMQILTQLLWNSQTKFAMFLFLDSK